jgi:sulfite exporter TauE/SafE/copper chaperone CopZ
MKKTFKIEGMHCNSCALLIEKSLKDKVNSIKASFAKEEAEINFDESRITESEIKEEITKLGYKIKQESNKSDKTNKIRWYVLAGVSIFALVLLYFLIKPYLPEINIPNPGDNISLILLFVAGLLTGFHCISMCGGFVVSYAAKNAANGNKGFKQHLVYGASKVVSYAIIGGIFGAIGGIFAFNLKLRGAVAILAGLFMLAYALSMFGFSFFKKFQFNPKFLSKVATSEHKGMYKGPFITGLLNGLFIACGPLQAMYIYAAGTGSFFSGFLGLAAFGLGTLPVMFGFAGLTTIISHTATKKILKISAVIVLILGLIVLNRGLNMLGSPISYEVIKQKIIGGASEGLTSKISGGSQIVNMDVSSSGYNPNSFVIKQGVPVVWNVNVKQLTGCNSELVMRDYGVDVKLKQGLNVINFTPNKAGTIRFSCGMGMLTGSFLVTETGTATQQEVAAATPKSSGSCSIGSSCGCGM